jgi:hypothetical protein
MTRDRSFTPLVTYLIRRSTMYSSEQAAQVYVHERQLQAEADARAYRLFTARRLQRKAEKASRRARLARLALR